MYLETKETEKERKRNTHRNEHGGRKPSLDAKIWNLKY